MIIPVHKNCHDFFHFYFIQSSLPEHHSTLCTMGGQPDELREQHFKHVRQQQSLYFLIKYIFLIRWVPISVHTNTKSLFQLAMSLLCLEIQSQPRVYVNNLNSIYRCTAHFVVHFSNTPTNAHIVFNKLKFTLKHSKRSYKFRSYDHPQGAYFVPC